MEGNGPFSKNDMGHFEIVMILETRINRREKLISYFSAVAQMNYTCNLLSPFYSRKNNTIQ